MILARRYRDELRMDSAEQVQAHVHGKWDSQGGQLLQKAFRGGVWDGPDYQDRRTKQEQRDAAAGGGSWSHKAQHWSYRPSKGMARTE